MFTTAVCPKTNVRYRFLYRKTEDGFADYEAETIYVLPNKTSQEQKIAAYITRLVGVGDTALFSCDTDSFTNVVLLRNLGSQAHPLNYASITTRLSEHEHLICYVNAKKYFETKLTLVRGDIPDTIPPGLDGMLQAYEKSPGRWVQVPLRHVFHMERVSA